MRFCTAFSTIVLLRSVSSLRLPMHRFLTGASESANKRVRTESPTRVSAVEHRTPPVLSPTILLKEDLEHISGVKANEWVSYGGIMYKLGESALDATEMVAFDMDGTLIKTKSGKTFPTDENDWVLWDPSVRPVLQRLHAENKYLVIISNQNGIKENKVTRAAVQRKVDKIISTLGVPMDFICATEDDRYRKPRPGMWEFLCYARSVVKQRAGGDNVAAGRSAQDVTAVAEGGIVPALALSTYVGDAAGRPKEGTRGKDFADSDYKLALNLGIKFSTPEQLFLGSTSRLHCQLPLPGMGNKEDSAAMRLVDLPHSSSSLNEEFFAAPEKRHQLHVANTALPQPPLPPASSGEAPVSTEATAPAPIPDTASFPTAPDTSAVQQTVAVPRPELLLLAAPPACGKSTLARRFERGGYLRVNQDTLGSFDKCAAAAKSALQAGQSVCVDNTNMDLNTRAKWVQLAKQCNVAVRAVALKTAKEACNLLSTFRLLDPTTAAGDRRKIERVVVNTYFKAPVYPTAREGFTRVDSVELDLIPPADPQALRYFHMYLKG